MAAFSIADIIPSPAHLYDALDAEGVVIHGCAPVGMVSSLHAQSLADFFNPLLTLDKIAETLLCSRERLALETERTGFLEEAFSLILEEQVRGAVFAFADLLVSYSIDSQAGLMISPAAERACVVILESRPARGCGRMCADSDTQNRRRS